jgi:peptidoglycan/xylan/chitin deacetylase (PgdA/CDA1 family)
MNNILLQFTFLLRLVLKITNKPVVLCYHRISKTKFDAQVTFFKKIASVKSFKNLVHASSNATPKFAIALTMDDCYYEDFINATQVLEKHKLPCTFFVPTKYSVENTPLWPVKIVKMLSTEKLRFITEEKQEKKFENTQEQAKFKGELIKTLLWNENQTAEIENEVEKLSEYNGYLASEGDKVIDEQVIKMYAENPLFSFQSHTVTHPKLYLQNNDELKHEFEESKKYLQKASGEEQYLICYPYGSAKHIGNAHTTASKYYTHGVTLQTGSIRKTTNPMLIPRIGIYEHDTPFRIFFKILNSQFK